MRLQRTISYQLSKKASKYATAVKFQNNLALAFSQPKPETISTESE